MEFLFGILESHFIRAVNNPDDSISLFEVISPIGSDGFLSTNIPYIEFKVLVL